MVIGVRASGRTLLVGALVTYAVLMLTQPLPRSLGEPLTWFVHGVTVLVASVAMLRRGRAAHGALRQARTLLACSMLAGAAAGVLAAVWSLVGELPPAPSIIDVLHLSYVPLVAVGLLRYPVTEHKPGSAARALLDGTVAAAALWFFVYRLFLEPASVGDDLPLRVQLLTLSYPAGGVFVLGLLASVLARVAPAARRELVLVGSGLALFATADLLHSMKIAQGTYRADSWVGLLFELGLLLVVYGALSAGAGQPRVPRWSRALGALPQLPVFAAIGTAASLALTGRGIDGLELGAGVVLVGALSLRQIVSSRDRQVLNDRLKARDELFRSLVTGASDLITLHDADGLFLYASPAVGRMFGIDEEQLRGRSVLGVVEPEDRAHLQEAFTGVLAEPGAQAETLVRVHVAGGEARWMQVLLNNQLHDPSVRGVVVNGRDVHERHLLERQLAYAAYHDALTGLGNLAQARSALAEAYAAGRGATVVLVDLDGFKSVNDTFGHPHGDELLCRVAEQLSSGLRAEDQVTRIGGDEFVLIFAGEHDPAGVSARVLEQLRKPVSVGSTTLSVRASLGVALTRDAASPDELLRNADLAMYASKGSGRDCVTWYEPWMHEAAARRMALHDGLRRALAQGQLSLYYQPIVQLPGGAVVGAEALLRWEHPADGFISPEVFIPIAEDSGIIGDIDLWVLDRACADMAAWRASGLDVPQVSINVSRRQMTLELPGLVAAALDRYGLPGSALCIEVTESAVVPDADIASEALCRVRECGVAVALDDFGSGQSSLSQLARLPVDSVKIDRSFTSTAMSDAAALRLLTSIVGVCQALSLPMVAEGIEQKELAQFLAGIGCERGQGYHFARPQPAERFRALLSPVRLPAARLALDDVRVQVEQSR